MHHFAKLARIVFILVLIGALFCMLVPIGMRYAMQSYEYVSPTDVPQTEVAIVLGASVAHGLPSPVLAARADAAIKLYNTGKVSKILVTGDNGALSHDEVTPVRKYLLDAGIPGKDIFLDHAGFDTYSSMYRARYIFGATSATIVTQDFHLPRALFVARELGISAYGYDADNRSSLPLNYIREIPASTKALWDIMTHREPKYLGNTILLSSDGQTTWY
jgi:SanA protein